VTLQKKKNKTVSVVIGVIKNKHGWSGVSWGATKKTQHFHLSRIYFPIFHVGKCVSFVARRRLRRLLTSV